MNEINWIQKWYTENCDGYWEHMFGIRIFTLDNPGWGVDIELSDTEYYLEECQFEKIRIERNDSDWVWCEVENEKFKGRGGSENLSEILEIFREWVEQIKQNSIDV